MTKILKQRKKISKNSQYMENGVWQEGDVQTDGSWMKIVHQDVRDLEMVFSVHMNANALH
jgi:hypothetical protein